MKFKTGEYIKIHPKHSYNSWYHTDIMRIIGYGKNISGKIVYIVDYKFKLPSENKGILIYYCFQDDECRKMIRESKLKRILNNG